MASPLLDAGSHPLESGLFMNSHIVMLLIDPATGTIMDANPAAVAFYGFTRDELTSMRVFSLNTLPEAEVLRKMREADKGKSRKFAFEHRLANGEVRDVEVFSGPVTAQGRKLLYSIIHDVTERRRTEEALRHSELILAQAGKMANLGAWEIEISNHEDLNANPLRWSDEVYRIFGYSPGEVEVTNATFFERVHPEDRQRIVDMVAQAIALKKPYSLEHRIVRPDGTERIVFEHAEITFDDQDRPVHIIGAVQDITERKLTEDELQRTHDELEKRVAERTAELAQTVNSLQAEVAERLGAMEELRAKDQMLLQQSRHAAMGEMIGNIAHQWRQPLNTLGLLIQQLTALAEAGRCSGEQFESNTRKAMQLIFHMSQTIDDFRNFFRPDKERVTFNARAAIVSAISLIDGSFRSLGIPVEFYGQDDLSIDGYPNEFSQVLLNILINARDAFSERRTDTPRVKVSLFAEKGKTVVTIADNAGGIAEEIMARIFDPYFTTKGPDKGTGVGLYMSKSIIEKSMNGLLTVRNTGGGAEFRIEVNHGAQ